jgi:Zn-dependent peptidase ImmA (M78 family)/transcriptional regulator with XRE-family HTH domain
MNNIEQGRHIPTGRILMRLADALDVTVDEILGRTYEVSGASPACLKEEQGLYLVSAIPASERKAPYAEPVLLSDDDRHDDEVRERLERIIRAFLMLEDVCGAQKRALIPLFASFTRTDTGMEMLARQVRTSLGIGEGVIFDYLELLENAGLRIVFCDLRAHIHSAAYYDRVNANAFIFVHDKMNAERQIFELIKRLGAIYLFTDLRKHENAHGVKPALLRSEEPLMYGSRAEKLLDERHAVRRFTAAFLMPETAVRASVAQLGIRPHEWTYELLLRIKHRFGVSAQSFLYRLTEFSLISEELAIRFRARIELHYKKTDFGEPDDSKRLLFANGRLGDLLEIASKKKSARKDVAACRAWLRDL